MARDLSQARAVLGDPAAANLLRVYSWDAPAVTLGRRHKPSDLPEALRAQGFPLGQRPTGGAVVVHSLNELTYAVVIRRGDPNETSKPSGLPGLIHRRLRDKLVEKGWVSGDELVLARGTSNGCRSDGIHSIFCFESPVCGDLIFRGRKVGGAALRAWREGFLVQGSLQGLPVPAERLTGVLLEAVKSLA